MATLTEKLDSRERYIGEFADSDPRESITFHYILDGVTDDSTAKTLLLNSTPATYDGLVRDECELEPMHIDTVDGIGKWACTVRYVTPEFEVGDSVFVFDTGGGTQHITQSLDTVGYYGVVGFTPSNKGAIGVTPDGVEGVDIVVPVYRFSEMHWLSAAFVDAAYRATLFDLTGKVNNASWNGFAAGEVLFEGAAGSKRGTGDWEIAFRFAASPNVTGLAVGDITGIDKKGWEYLWVRYVDGVDAAAKAPIRTPKYAYVEKVYEERDFSALGF